MLFICNGIGNEGAKSIGEALKTNSALTVLYMGFSFIFLYENVSLLLMLMLSTKLKMKEPRPLEKD